MAFALLTYRESLRDIATCLRAKSTKVYLLGIRGAVAPADETEARDWRIYSEFAQPLIHIAGRLYVDDPSVGASRKASKRRAPQ
jgi:Domain of unknown function (DUF4372)